ncbi:diguanylate phosphodiesterase [Vibrio proteolyticus]
MASLISNQAMYHYLRELIEQYVVTDDDKIIFEAFLQNDVRHACQAIRDAYSGEVEYQHLTLRFGNRSEQSVYQFDLSQTMQYCLDLYSLYLALRQTRFQMETFHPDLISNVVVPIRMSALLWEPGLEFLHQIFRHHQDAFAHVIPSLQMTPENFTQADSTELVEQIRTNAYALWFELCAPGEHFEPYADFKPDMIKFSFTLESKEDRSSFLPIIRFLRKHRLSWTAGRVASQIELNQCKLLGASHYFGYFSDIPTSVSFRSFDEADNEECR